MKLDITLRALTGTTSPVLIGMIGGAGLVEALPTEFPDARDRRVDTLARLDDGHVLHIEWQTGFDAAMPQRMLGYWLLIAAAYPGTPLRQVVIQVGGDRLVADTLKTDTLVYRYRVIDSRAQDPAPLLDSPAIEDNILAVLFGPPAGLRPRVCAILRRLAGLDQRARRDALTRLLILAGLRHATGLVLEEANAMPLQLDIERDPYLAQLLRQGEARGEAKALIRLAERRFGPLPAGLRERILAADAATVEAWFDRAIDAPDLSVVFAGT